MFYLKIFTVFVITSCVYADSIWEQGLQKFIKKYEHGDSEKNIKPMDPIIISNIDIPEEDLEMNIHFSELKVSGLKDAVVSGFSKNKFDIVNLDISFSFDAEGPIKIQFPKKNKNLEGTVKHEADIKAHVSHSTAKKIFSVDINDCKASNAKYTIDDKLIQILKNDPDAIAIEPKYDSIYNEHVKKVSCAIAKAMIRGVFDNIRTAIAADPLSNLGLKNFIKENEHGNREKNIKAMDPTIITNIDVPEETLGMNIHCSELTVSGLKDAVVSGFSKDENEVSSLNISFSFDAKGPVKIQFPKKNKEFGGTIRYEADIKTHVSHFAAKNEFRVDIKTCDASNAQYTIDDKLIQLLEKDPDASAVEPQFDSIYNEHVKKVSCEIAKAVIRAVFDNIRNAAAANVKAS